jgi:hypothetical protein
MRPAINTVLEDVRLVKALLIQVATGERRIQDTEKEFAHLRSKVATALQSLGINDPNEFRSLWDWYAYWRSNNLTTYQSRRDFVNSRYEAVVEVLEQQAARTDNAQVKGHQPFSVRHGYAPEKATPPIAIREDAPVDVRSTIVKIAVQTGWEYDDLFELAARVGKRLWESPEPAHSGFPSRNRLNVLIIKWEWFRVYDFVEQIYAEMAGWHAVGEPEKEFECKLNEYFEDSGVGWRLENGTITSRGSESFEATVATVIPALREAGLQTAEREIHEALSDLSRRPNADLTGAIQPAMAAECVARRSCGEPNLTLGKLLERHPTLVPKPLDSAVEKAWGYASERGRHIREGDEPTRDEVELIVGIAATVASFLSRKLP